MPSNYFLPLGRWPLFLLAVAGTFWSNGSLSAQLDPQGPVAVLRGHVGSVESARFAADGKVLASCGNDGTVRLWDTRTWTLEKTYPTNNGVQQELAFSPDGRFLTSLSRNGGVWALDRRAGSGTILMNEWQLGDQVRWGITSQVFSPDGQYLITGDCFGRLDYWRLAITDGRLAAKNAFTAKLDRFCVTVVALSSDPRYLVLAGTYPRRTVIRTPGIESESVSYPTSAKQLKWWDIEKKKERARIKVPAGWDFPLTVGAGQLLLFVQDNEIRRFNMDVEQEAAAIGLPPESVGYSRVPAVSADGKLVAVGRGLTRNEDDRLIRVVNVATGQVVAVLSTSDRSLFMTFSPDSRYLATGYGATIKVYRLAASP